MVRPRSWTDDQLREAVASASTWGEVVTAVGRVDNAKARAAMQGHATRLGLDVAHLPTFKPVDPIYPYDSELKRKIEMLSEIVPEVTSWAEAFRRLNLKVTGSGYLRLKRTAQELGIDTSHFRGQGWSSKPIRGVSTPFSHDQDGAYFHKAAASLAAAWFLERGYMVSIPVEPARYDMVVESDEGLAKVQVKSTRSQDKAGRWVVGVYRQAYDPSARTTRVRREYDCDEIDYFFVVTSNGDKYLIPRQVTGQITNLTLDSKYAEFRLDQVSAEGEPDRRAGPRC